MRPEIVETPPATAMERARATRNPIRKLYFWTLHWAATPHALPALVLLSFAESSFFPVPPDVMLAPMILARPQRGWRLALMTTVASVLGGAAGYAIGWLALESVQPLLVSWGYWDAYLRATAWFETWGVLAIFVAGFSPIPYKVFTISSGVFSINLGVFVVASILSRGLRFFAVAALIHHYGAPVKSFIDRYFNLLTWAFGILIVLGFVVIEFVL